MSATSARRIILTCVLAMMSAVAVMAQKPSSPPLGEWAGADASLLGGDAFPDIVVSPGSGVVPTRVIDGATMSDLGGGFPFGPTFGAGVLTATGELSGDTTADIAVGMGPGGGLVQLFNGATLAVIGSGHPFGGDFTGGVTLAVGDLNGDGRADIVTGQASGGGAVRVFSGINYSTLLSQTPFGPGYIGGVNVAAGDVDGDGRVEVIVAQAAGGTVAVISGATQAITLRGAPYGELPGGVFVAAADVNGDGRADVIAAPGSGDGPVIVYNIATLRPIITLAPYGTTSPGGVRVAATDLTGDGHADIITVPGPGREPELKIFSGGTFNLLAAQLAFQPTYTSGVFVSAPPARRVGTPVTNWNVTQRFVSVSGPDNCWIREQRQRLTGVVFRDLPMAITRSNGVTILDGGYFQVNYRGTYAGTELTASGVAPLEGGGRPCQDGTSFTQLDGASALSGSFSADDQRATLAEVNSYRLTTGELVTYTWEWQATRRP